MLNELKTLCINFNHRRMVLYYPVSALVTLFANILQNPQDSRARSDLKLMNVVVEFLSMLSNSEGSGAIRHMLNICTEFERISQVVLDKSDRESHSRRKRKQQDSSDTQIKTPQAAKSNTPGPSEPGNIPNVFSPPPSLFLNSSPCGYANVTPEMRNATLVSGESPFLSPGASITSLESTSPISAVNAPPTVNTPFSFTMGSGASIPLATSGSGIVPNAIIPVTLSGAAASSIQTSNTMQSLANSFQNPFVPQDLWQMPMSLEWDWADMTSGFTNGSSFENNGVSNNLPPTDAAPGAEIR